MSVELRGREDVVGRWVGAIPTPLRATCSGHHRDVFHPLQQRDGSPFELVKI